MRRIMILVGAVALLTMAFSAAAYAKDFQCTTKPCYGTNKADVITERGGSISDVIYAQRGDDRIYANVFGGDIDKIYGQRGDDTLWANDGDSRDYVSGGPGLDVCYVDYGDTVVSCEVVFRY